MDQNQLVIQSLKGADPTMVHQADAPNPVPSIIDAFRSYLPNPPDLNPVHLPGTEPKDYLRELLQNPDILAKNVNQASNFNFGGMAGPVNRNRGIIQRLLIGDKEFPIKKWSFGYTAEGVKPHGIDMNEFRKQHGSFPDKKSLEQALRDALGKKE